MAPIKVLEYIVILCLERQYPKRNSVIRRKSKILTPQIFGLLSLVKLSNSMKANFFGRLKSEHNCSGENARNIHASWMML